MKLFISATFIVLFLFTSCNKFSLDKEPIDSASNDKILSTIQGIQSALTGCYNDLQSPYYYGRNYILINDIYSDNGKLSRNNVGHFTSFYNYSVTTDNEELKNLWATGYKIITNTNNILEAIENIENISENEKNIVIGEALSLRALVNFDLVRIFAHDYSTQASSGVSHANGNGGHDGIPLLTTPITLDSANKLTRSTVAQVYTQIKKDLILADSLLENQTNTSFRFNQNSANALLSIVYLTTKEYNKALELAETIIQENSYDLLTYNNYYMSWSQEFSSESILSIAMGQTDYPGTNSIGHMLSPEGYGGIVPSQDLIDLFTPSDIRLSFLKKTDEDYFIKYPGRNDMLGVDNIPIIRLSELYFVIAECYAIKGKSVAGYNPLAQDALSKIIQRSENSSAPVTLTGDNLLDKIYTEYRKEFAFEGKRFLQLKRIGKDINRIDCTASICSINNPSFYFAFPIPVAELNVNKNITQNLGY